MAEQLIPTVIADDVQGLDAPAQHMRHPLQPVTNSEHRQAHGQHARIARRRAGVIYGIRSA